jgi:hypothetical protein
MQASNTLLPVTGSGSVRIIRNTGRVLTAAAAAVVLLFMVCSFDWLLKAYQLVADLV